MRSLPHACPARSELARICRRFNAKLIRVTENDFNVFDWNHASWLYPCPFDDNIGIYWCRRIIYYHGDIHWGSLLHEVAHVVASKLNPNNADEWSFLGWEMTVAKKLGWLQWVNNNGSYQLHQKYDFLPIDRATPALLQEVFEGRVAYAKEIGLLTPSGQLSSFQH